jgi:hypothetical protein
MQHIEILEQSVKSLFLTMQVNGNKLSTGTGFLARSPIGYVLITNRHNVTGRNNDTDEPLSRTGGIPNEVTILHNKLNTLGSWISHTEPLYDKSNNPLWHEHPFLGAQADFVALPLTQTEDIEFRIYDLDENSLIPHPKPSDIISVVGFPFGITINGGMAIWATGFIASEPNLPSPCFLIDSRTRPGQSGSVVIAQRNNGCTFRAADGSTKIITGIITQFLGIYSGRINCESDIGVVWKASIIKELIASLK